MTAWLGQGQAQTKEGVEGVKRAFPLQLTMQYEQSEVGGSLHCPPNKSQWADTSVQTGETELCKLKYRTLAISVEVQQSPKQSKEFYCQQRKTPATGRQFNKMAKGLFPLPSATSHQGQISYTLTRDQWDLTVK